MAVLLNLDLIIINQGHVMHATLNAHAAKVKSRVWTAWHRNKEETDRPVNCELANELVLWTVGSSEPH